MICAKPRPPWINARRSIPNIRQKTRRVNKSFGPTCFCLTLSYKSSAHWTQCPSQHCKPEHGFDDSMRDKKYDKAIIIRAGNAAKSSLSLTENRLLDDRQGAGNSIA